MTQPTHGLDPNALEAALTDRERIAAMAAAYPDAVADLTWAEIEAVLASLPQQTAEPVIELPSQWPFGTRVKVPGDSRIGRVSDYGSAGMVHVDFPVGSWYGKIAEVTLWDDYRDVLGRVVREAWVRWAKQQPSPKPSWLVPYDQLSEPDKEADRQIGEALAQYAHPGHPASPPVGGAVTPVAEVPLVSLRPESTVPEWQQVIDLFEQHGLAAPPWRLRDELVNWLTWARYGEATALASSERSGREAVVCSVKTMKLSDGREDHFVSIRVGDREITPYRFTIKGRAEFEVAELNWLLNGAEKPDILDWLDRTRDPSDPTEAAIRNLAGTKTND